MLMGKGVAHFKSSPAFFVAGRLPDLKKHYIVKRQKDKAFLFTYSTQIPLTFLADLK
jgi:hypothetical protein